MKLVEYASLWLKSGVFVTIRDRASRSTKYDTEKFQKYVSMEYLSAKNKVFAATCPVNPNHCPQVSSPLELPRFSVDYSSKMSVKRCT